MFLSFETTRVSAHSPLSPSFLQLYNLDEKLKKQTSDLRKQVTNEGEARNKDVEALRRDMARAGPRGPGGPPVGGATQQDMDAVCIFL